MAYTTSTAAKTYLKIDSTADNALLTSLIARAQAAIDRVCARSFEATAATRYYDVIRDVQGRELMLDEDLIAVTTLTNKADSASVSETWGSSEYVLLPTNTTPKYKVMLKDNSTKDWDYGDSPERAISITGSWGFATTPPADIVHATIRLTSYYYRQKDAGVFDVQVIPDAGVVTVPQGMPADVKLILAPYIRRVF